MTLTLKINRNFTESILDLYSILSRIWKLMYKKTHYTQQIGLYCAHKLIARQLDRTRSGSVLTGLIPPAATNSSFSKSRSKSRSRSQGPNFLVPRERCCHKKYTHVIWKAPSLLIKKLCLRLSFFKSRSKVKVKVTRSKCLVRRESSCHKEHTCVIGKPYLF